MTIKIEIGGQELAIDGEAGQSLSSVVWLSGLLKPLPLCSGLGTCGLCRVKFKSSPPPPLEIEIKRLGEELTAEGWRLSCRHFCPGPDEDISLLAPPDADLGISPRVTLTLPRVSGPLLLAVDLGTTSIHFAAIEARSGRIAAEGRELNPQFGAGAEVMSRLAMAAKPEGQKKLSALITDFLKKLLDALPAPVEKICLAANTAMTAILLGKDISGLAGAPYRLDYEGGNLETLPGLPPIFIPPLLAPFIGADISAGLISLLLERKPDYPFLLADLGTNGEFALAASPNRIFIASVPLGPALEGIGLTHGKMAGPGVAGSFSVTPRGLVPVESLNPAGLKDAQSPEGSPSPVQAICGSGYLSLLHALLRLGVLDNSGHFRPSPPHPLGQRLAASLKKENGGVFLPLPGKLALYPRDIEEILKVKAAFSLAVDSLPAAADLKVGALKHIFLAGALGEHADPADLEALGFIPQGLARNLTRAGNSSLAGAILLLKDQSGEKKAGLLKQTFTLVDLAARKDLSQAFAERMKFGFSG